ncbi:MAG: esterase family protein [Anaerolineae bacterium]|nr:esterase family protein [Anaerolineae bacterium]
MCASKIVIETFHSQALADNPLGDEAIRRVPVYLPPGYDQGEDRYPVVYLLAAFARRGLKFLNDDMWEETIQERLDRLIETQAIRPMLVVMPDASTRYGGSQYLNSTATGNYTDHILELVSHIDVTFRSAAKRGQRAVMGHSSGGYGALLFGMRYPEVFGLVADHSGDKYFELVFQPDFGVFLRYYERAGEEGLRQMLADPGKALRQGTPFTALAVAAMAACYSPNPEAPFGFDLPFDLHNGRLRPEVWARWQALDPVHMVEQYAEALRSLQLLFFDCGTRDEHNLLYGARIFAQELEKHGIVHTFEEFDDGHRNVDYRFDVSLRAISQSMG